MPIYVNSKYQSRVNDKYHEHVKMFVFYFYLILPQSKLYYIMNNILNTDIGI